MHVVTPIEYVEFFVGMIPIGKGIKLIIQTQGDISFIRFLPSVIATSALLSASRFLYKDLYDRKNMFRVATKYMDEVDLEACLEDTYRLCIAKKILLERDVGFEERRKVEEITQVGETLSSISNGAGEEPMQDQIKDEPHGKIDPEMNFELKWLMWISEDPEEWTINSPHFRTPAPIPDDPDDGRVEARNSFGNICQAVIEPFKSCIVQ